MDRAGHSSNEYASGPKHRSRHGSILSFRVSVVVNSKSEGYTRSGSDDPADECADRSAATVTPPRTDPRISDMSDGNGLAPDRLSIDQKLERVVHHSHKLTPQDMSLDRRDL
jgi:hypothetical protein